jgi:hypothetical protein
MDYFKHKLPTSGVVPFLLGSALAILALATYLAWPLVELPPPPGSPPETIQERERRQQEMVAAIIRSGNIDGCVQARGVEISGLDYEAVCRNNIAYQRAFDDLDVTACQALGNSLMDAAECQRDVVRLQLRQRTELATCATLPDGWLKSFCLETYWRLRAVADRNPERCLALEEPAARLECQEYTLVQVIIAGERPPCEVLTGDLADDCRRFRAAETRRTGCTALRSGALRSLCEAEVP